MAQEKNRKKPTGAGGNQKTSKTGSLSPEEKRLRAQKKREAEKRRQEEALRRKMLRQERRRQLFHLSFFLSLVFVLLYWGYVALAIANRSDGREEAQPLLLFTEGERKEDSRWEPEESFFSGSYYLPITALEEYMTISQFGDYQTRSFLLLESGEYATFYLGTPEGVINGEKVSLQYPVFLKEDVLYLPIDFFTDKMNCFQFTSSSALAAGVITYQAGIEPSFRFHGTPVSETVSFDTVPVAPTLPAPEGQDPT